MKENIITQKTLALLPDASAGLIRTALEFCRSLTALDVGTDDEFRKAGELLVIIRNRRKEIEEDRKLNTAPLKEAAKKIEAEYKEPLDAILNLEDRLNKGMGEYQKKLDAEKARLDAIARKKADDERLKLAEDAKKEADNAVAASKDGNTLGAVLAQGRATQAMTKAENLKPEKVEAVKADGVSFRDNWKAKVVDLDAFINWDLKENDADSFLIVDQARLDRYVQAQKGAVTIPGVEIIHTKSTVVKTGR